jgi:hypothetical protein
MRLRFLSPKILLATLELMGCFSFVSLTVAPIISTQPSRQANRHWEEDYSRLLPPGYTDFRGHWQSQDVGVRIFSFHCPDGWNGERALGYLAERTSQLKLYEIYQEKPGEVALRQPVNYSGPGGFNEFRFSYRSEHNRIYGMFANLDSEMDVHGALVKQLHEIADGDTG